jgi:ectoine hydroxylase-related dioxygenase (phytanoyl-CoA dioxygenase family)
MNFAKELKNRGYIKLKNFFSKSAIKKIQKDFFFLSEKLYQKHYDLNCKKYLNKDGFDSYCVESFVKNNSFNSKFYEVCKKLNSFHELFYKKKVINLMEKIFNKKNFGILNRGYGFRFDYPSDKTFLTQLHQDYTSNLGSPLGYVLISPLKDIKSNMGPIRFYPGSHKYGIAKIRVNNIKNLRKSRQYEVVIDNKKILNNPELIKANERDLIIVDFKTLHESTYNSSINIRFTMIYRFIDYEDPTSINLFVPGGEQDNNYFDNFHKEKIVK